MPVYVSAVTSMEVFIFHTPRMKLSYLCRIGDNLNPFTQNNTPWFDMCLGAILLNSYVNSTSTGQKTRDGVRLRHLGSF
jgi:hypothetical protein